MRVVAMALLECIYWLCGLLAIGLAFLSGYWSGFAFLTAGLMLLCLATIVWSIPLNLNWSRSLYGHLVNRVFVFMLMCILAYAICYDSAGLETDGREAEVTFVDAVYFSTTTFTTLGYGDFRPTPSLRIVSSLQAITGLLFMPLVASLIWLYCQERLWSVPRDAESRARILMIDQVTGVWVEPPSEGTESEQAERMRRFRPGPCWECKHSTLRFEKYYELLGRLHPFPRFRISCVCGNATKGLISAHRTAYRWNRASKRGRSRADA